MTGRTGSPGKRMYQMRVFLKSGTQIRFTVNRPPEPGEDLLAFIGEANGQEEDAAVKVVHLTFDEVAAVTVGPGEAGNGKAQEGTG